MAYYSIFPEIDTTLYSHPNRSTMNTGHDEILELVKEKGTSDTRYHPSRILVKFSNDDLKLAIKEVGALNFQTGREVTCSLQLFSTEHKNLTTIINLDAFPIAQIWDEGTGRYSNLPTSSDGASWVYSDNDIDKTQWPTSSFNDGVTGSINTSSAVGIAEGGGVQYTGSGFYGTQQFLKGDNLDTNIEVTDIIRKWSASLFVNQEYPTGIYNNGFIIKKPDIIETGTSSSFGELKWFSVNTHTIYPPKLTFKWKDSIHNYQSSAKLNGELNVSLYRNKEEYNQNEIATLRIHVRDKYPVRQFATSSNYLDTGYFTTKSYYSIRDAHTEEEIIPFDDNNTQLSADSQGMYFKLYMKGLQPERYYRLLFKHINNDGTTIYDNDYNFKVIR